MIERQVDVVERIPDLVCDGGSEPANDCAFFSLVKLSFKLASTAEFRSHLVEGRSECAHLIESISRHLDVEVSACHFPRCGREFFYWASKAPDKETGDKR